MSDAYRALVVDKTDSGVSLSIRERSRVDLDQGDVTIKVAYSCVNYKDGLAVRADGKVARKYPLVPGIDLSGTVLESGDRRFREGDHVIAHAYDLGMGHDGGYSELERVPGDWVLRLPPGLSLRDAMAIGTAGFTAAMSVEALEKMGVRPDSGPVIVTGASGGVGSSAISMLAALGYHVVASTGSADAHDFLREIGASETIDRSETSAESSRPLEKSRWAGAVDAVGGATLAYLLRTMNYGGTVAASGNAGGVTLNTTVFPFILRGVNLLGIDSANMPMERRETLWNRLATELKPRHLDRIVAKEVSLEELPEALEAVHRGEIRGRVVVRIG